MDPPRELNKFFVYREKIWPVQLVKVRKQEKIIQSNITSDAGHYMGK